MASGMSGHNPHWGDNFPKQPQVATTTFKTVIPSLDQIFTDQFFLGFHDQLTRWKHLTDVKKTTSFPPYNIIKVDDDNYNVELAVAGYSKDDIDITVDNDLLIVKSNKLEKGKEEFVHQGIAERTWEQQFVLGEYMKITKASLKDGLLVITVERELPEELKPKKITIL
jgi:molecular chaperone IbpA